MSISRMNRPKECLMTFQYFCSNSKKESAKINFFCHIYANDLSDNHFMFTQWFVSAILFSAKSILQTIWTDINTQWQDTLNVSKLPPPVTYSNAKRLFFIHTRPPTTPNAHTFAGTCSAVQKSSGNGAHMPWHNLAARRPHPHSWLVYICDNQRRYPDVPHQSRQRGGTPIMGDGARTGQGQGDVSFT